MRGSAMTCEHVKELYRLCQAHDLKLTSGDLIRIVCPQCGVADVCLESGTGAGEG